MTFEYLWNLEKFGSKLGLENMKKALDKLGNPERELKVIHVAGTNGKGSVSAMLCSILTEAGYKTGMYTSPHLIKVNERFRIDEEEISDEELSKYIGKIREIGVEVTFFEFLTLIAISYFRDAKVEHSIFETGLGGRLDATNVFENTVSIITSLGYDHTNILGKSIEEITKEKCDILRKKSPVFTANSNKENITLKQECNKKECKLTICPTSDRKTNLKGKFQEENAGIACSVAEHLGINEETINKGLQKIRWTGRAYHLKENIIFDCAHNTEGIKAIKNYIEGLEYNRLNIIFGCSDDKNTEEMIKNLPKHHELILTTSDNKKAMNPNNITTTGKVIENHREAYKYGIDITGQKDMLLICGSCYLVGDILKYLSKT